MRRHLLVLLLPALIMLHAVVPHEGPHAALAQVAAFVATFDGSPPAPLAINPADWDVQVYHQGKRPDDFPAVIGAEHGTDCSAPPAMHTVSTPVDAVFLCNGHVMTTIDHDYGAVYLTPPEMLDFSNGEGVIRFDLNTDMHSYRDWIEVRVTPYEDNLAHTGGFDSGMPQRSVNIWSSFDTLHAETVTNHAATEVPGACCLNWGKFLAPSQTRRDTFEVHISRTHIRVGMPAFNQWWVDRDIAPLDWSQGIVQFSEHSYSSSKGCERYNPDTHEFVNDTAATNCPNTWHWDNLSIAPAVPFTILKGDRKWTGAEAPVLNLNGATPTDAMLRFAALGTNIQFSVDNGATWISAVRANEPDNNDDAHWRDYWTPIPAGVTRITFRGTDNAIRWAADGISVFARGGNPGPPPATATQTPVPTMTPVPSATPTQTPVPASCEVRVRVAGVEQWIAKPATFCQS